MFKIKYGKSKGRAFLTVLLFLFAFLFASALGGVGTFFFVKSYVDEIKSENKRLTEKIDELTLLCAKKDSMGADESGADPETREVWVSFIEYSGYINAGDLIDVRVVDASGDNIKKLSEKQITVIDSGGMQILVNEEDLDCITDIECGVLDGTIKRVYAVKIP